MFIQYSQDNEAHKSKYKHMLLTRPLAFLLSIAMCISPLTSLTAYADSGVGNAGDNSGGNTGSTNGTSSMSDVTWNPDAQGYRIYVVNSNLERISPVYDFTFSEPWAGVYDYTTRFDTAASPNEYYYGSDKDLMDWCDSDKEVPKPTKKVDGVRVPNGAEFKEWFFNGRKGNTISKDGKPGSSVIGGNKGTGGSTTSTPNYPNTMLATTINMSASEFALYIFQYNKLTQMFSSWTDSLHVTTEDEISLMDYTVISNTCSKINAIVDQYYSLYSSDLGKWLDANTGYSDGKGDLQLTESALRQYAFMKAYYNGFDLGIDDGYLVEDAYFMYFYGKAAFLRIFHVYDIVDGHMVEITNTLFQPSTTSNLLTQSIPLAGSTGTSDDGGGAGMPAYNLINKEDTIKVPGYVRSGDAIEDGCYLIVEPITWLKVYQGGTWNSSSSYSSTKVYGTVWNIMKRSSTSQWANWSKILGDQMVPSLLTQADVVTSTGKVLYGLQVNSRPTPSQTVNWYDSGYGLSMHIYDANDFKEAAGTHTYDSPISPGSAPDPTALPNETEYGTESKKVTIIKNYVSITDGTESTIANYTRTLNPHIIQIEDEPQYKVVSWETSTTTPPSIPDGSTTPYSTITSSSTHTQTGTSPTSVTLDKTEKCLYVKLQKQNGTPVAVTGDWTLHESEITSLI